MSVKHVLKENTLIQNIRRTSANVIVSAFIIAFGSCSNDEVNSPPTIIEITPKAGVAGMQVTITGEGFSTSLEKNIISFNGVDAEVLSASATQLIVVVPEVETTGMVPTTIGSNQLEGPSFRYYDVFVLVNHYMVTTVAVKVLKNGTFIPITDGSEFTRGWSLAVEGDDIYVAGDTSRSSGMSLIPTPVYWKNNIMYPLPFESTQDYITSLPSISIDEGDVYISGNEIYPPNTIAKYWKNGEPTSLIKPDYKTNSTSVLALNGDVYVGGSIQNDIDNLATYWKNGVENIMPGDLTSSISQILMEGTDLYVLGNDLENSQVIYWKNNELVTISNGGIQAGAQSIAVSGSDVYIVGQDTPSALKARLWKNGIGEDVLEDDPNVYESYATDIIARDGNIIIMGVIRMKSGEEKAYIKINEYLQLIPLEDNMETSDLVVR